MQLVPRHWKGIVQGCVNYKNMLMRRPRIILKGIEFQGYFEDSYGNKYF